MKNIIIGLFITLTAICAAAQTDRLGWKVTVKVVDTDNLPISNATVAVWYYVAPPPGETEANEKIQGLTDANGIFTASNETNGSIDLGLVADKDGYYSAHTGHEFMKFKDSDPEKWNPHVTLLLKKIVKPIPMYAKSVNLGMPIFEKAVGFDLTAGDWVAPYGKGLQADILFTGHFDKKADGESDYSLTVKFPKVGDGIQEFSVPADQASGLRSPHEAPLDSYQSEWVQTDNRTPGKPIETNQDPDRNYFFRVRTVLDKDGSVKSALYGKIYGDFMQFIYYLNPTPNDPNVEFDPNHNLLGGLQSFEQVRRP